MIKISGATLSEKMLIKKVENATFAHLKQDDFFAIDMVIVDEETIKQLNKSARNVDSVTDVLSFPCFEKMKLPIYKNAFTFDDYDGKRVMLGSIMICRQRAIDQAQEYEHSYQRELGFLACHGFLHILGFDHIEKDDEAVMLEHQRKIMDNVGLKRF